MELRQYWMILLRWWWVAALPAFVVSGIGLATYSPPATVYATTVRLTASLPPTVSEASGFDPAYYSWLTSEYIVGALANWVKTGAFAQAVSADLAAEGVELPAEAIRGALISDYRRSELVLYFSAGTPDHLGTMADAAVEVLQSQNGTVFPQLGGRNAVVVALDEPEVTVVPPPLQAQLALPLRIGLGLGVGVALAFLAHYVDPMLRTREDVERLGLTIVGEIPRIRRSRR